MSRVAGRLGVRSWALWSLPRRARLFIVAVDALFVVAVIGAALTTRFVADDVTTFAILVGCAILSIEGSLRLVWRRPNQHRSNDLMAVWTLPVALLLPPLFAALVVLPIEAYFYLRVMRRAPMKWMFNTSAIGLAGFLAATAHAGLVSAERPWIVDTLVGSLPAVAATAACVLVRQGAIAAITAQLFAFLKPGSKVRDHLGDREQLGVILAEACTGVLVAIACAASSFAVLLALPPVLVLQRTLLVAEFREAARTDAKTGLANSSYWREVAEREIARARSGREPLAVLLVDVDHFKDVNDRYGHLTGDEVLRAVANALTDGLRPRDFVGRFGGEEFVVLLTGSDLEQGKHAAERIREHVADVTVEPSNRRDPVRVTISVGVAAFRESGHSVHELLDAADTALYAAKHAGRNCVRVAEGARQQVLDLTAEAPRVLDLRSSNASVD
ncbi:MAG TPA: GGDEF domain-containing protein [Acidothermaceae bacterium]|nr:GGDEF domain-containing protein [Acidothermaceae bacterium]